MLPLLFAAIAAALLAASIYWMWRSARSLLTMDGDAAALASANAERDALLEEKTALLRALRDLQMDRDAGKLADRDFARLDKRLRERTRKVLRALDAEIAPYRERARAMLEASAASAPAPDAKPTEQAAQAVPEATAHACGAVNDPDAVFCKRCGERLREDAQEQAP